MSYFLDVFLPSRTRIFHDLFSKHPWILVIRKIVLGNVIKFGVDFYSSEGVIKYTLEEGPDGSVKPLEGLEKIDFKIFGIPFNMVMHPKEEFLKSFVENEEKFMKRPLPYFLYYVIRTLPTIRLH
jgi:hypothetical protein